MKLCFFSCSSSGGLLGRLRVSERVKVSRTDSSWKALRLADLVLSSNTGVITIWSSKTDHLGKGACIELETCSDVKLCPVQALQEYLSLRGDTETPLFVHMDGSPLTRHQFWMVTSKVLASLGLAGVKFGTHSFWIGGTSMATAVGYLEDRV